MPCQLVAQVRTPSPAKAGCPPHATTTTSTNAAGWLTCLRSSSRRGAGATWRRSPSVARAVTLPFSDAQAGGQALSPEAEKVRVVLETTSTPIPERRSRRRLRPRKPQADLAPLGVPLYTQARLMAQPSRDRVLGVEHKQCLSERRIPNIERLAQEVWAWECGRNERRATGLDGASQQRTPGRSWHVSTRHNHSGGVLVLW